MRTIQKEPFDGHEQAQQLLQPDIFRRYALKNAG